MYLACEEYVRDTDVLGQALVHEFLHSTPGLLEGDLGCASR